MVSNIPRTAKFTVLALAAAIYVVAGGVETRAQTGHIVGRPAVIDADILDFSGQRVALSGIDGPELEQTCGAEGALWNCGLEARWALLNRVSRHWVTCVPETRQLGSAAPEPPRAVCYLAGVGQLDVAAWMVAEGWALVERGSGNATTYLAQETAAQKAGKGLWRGSFVAPWEWRQKHRN